MEAQQLTTCFSRQGDQGKGKTKRGERREEDGQEKKNPSLYILSACRIVNESVPGAVFTCLL